MIASSAQEHSQDLKRALLLTWVTIVWMVIEAVSALGLGWATRSLLLEGFGFDSLVELFSAFVLLWRLRLETCEQVVQERIEQAERRASKWIGYSLFVLAAYVAGSALLGLTILPRLTDTHESGWGILLGLISKLGMPVLAALKLKTAERLGSQALRADAIESVTCGYLSVVLMVGLCATRFFGWWWLDSVASLALIPFLIREGREAITGEGCCESCSGCSH